MGDDYNKDDSHEDETPQGVPETVEFVEDENSESVSVDKIPEES